MRIIRKLFTTLFCLGLLFGGFFIFSQLNDGFSINQIESDLPYYPQFEVAPLSLEKKGEIDKALQAPFHYIGKGCQFYVFESEDGTTVLKFLKQKHLRSFSWLQNIPAPESLSSYFADKIQRRKARVEKLFSSCKLAYEEMQKETGLLYVHLNRKPALEKTVTLIDKIGLKHTVLLDNYEFILQKKAISVQKVFENIAPEDVPDKVHSLMNLVVARCQKGIRDNDRSFVQNVAFSVEDGSAVFVDFGQFEKDSSILSIEEQKIDVQKRLFNLTDWTKRKFPDLLSLVEASIKEKSLCIL